MKSPHNGAGFHPICWEVSRLGVSVVPHSHLRDFSGSHLCTILIKPYHLILIIPLLLSHYHMVHYHPSIPLYGDYPMIIWSHPMIIPWLSHHQAITSYSAELQHNPWGEFSTHRRSSGWSAPGTLGPPGGVRKTTVFFAGSEAKWRGNTYKTPAKLGPLGWDHDDMLNHICICVCTIYRYNIHLYDYVITCDYTCTYVHKWDETNQMGPGS